MSMNARRRLSLPALVIAAAACSALLPGCIVVHAGESGWSAWDSDTVERTVNVNVPHESGKRIHVSTRNGAITVKRAAEAGGKDIVLTAKLRMRSQERLEKTTVSANRASDGTLEVKAIPAEDSWKSGEGCSFTLIVPEGVPVKLQSSNGAIEVAGMKGDSELDTSNGKIIVDGHEGVLDASTSNGRIETTGVIGAIKARSSNGAIKIVMAKESTGPIDASTSNGAIALDLSSNFAGTLSASTSNGSVELPEKQPTSGPGKDKFSVIQRSKRSGEIRVGDSAAESKLRTSNGGITVRFAEGG